MVALRLIPCLDVAKGRVVKGVNFVGLRDAGDPVELACRYSEAGADELVFLDIAASHEGRATLVDLVRRTAASVTIPFTVGGGIASVEGITELLRAGADKVSLNSSAVRRPELVSEGAERFGCQCIVVAIDARRRPSGGWDVYVKGGRENTGLDAVDWARRVAGASRLCHRRRCGCNSSAALSGLGRQGAGADRGSDAGPQTADGVGFARRV